MSDVEARSLKVGSLVRCSSAVRKSIAPGSSGIIIARFVRSDVTFYRVQFSLGGGVSMHHLFPQEIEPLGNQRER